MLKVTHRDLIDRALAEVDTLDVDDAIALLRLDDLSALGRQLTCTVRRAPREESLPGADVFRLTVRRPAELTVAIRAHTRSFTGSGQHGLILEERAAIVQQGHRSVYDMRRELAVGR